MKPWASSSYGQYTLLRIFPGLSSLLVAISGLLSPYLLRKNIVHCYVTLDLLVDYLRLIRSFFYNIPLAAAPFASCSSELRSSFDDASVGFHSDLVGGECICIIAGRRLDLDPTYRQ